MKKNIGAVLGLYPTPVTVVGTEIDGKVNWLNICHIGIVGIDKIMLSMGKTHYSNRGIRKNRTVSVNLANSDMLVKADYVGLVSGNSTDKSDVFEYYYGTLKGAPLIKDSPLSMECEVVDNYETETHDNFILKIVNTYVNEDVLDEDGKIDYERVKPVLFEMPQRSYLTTGKVIAKCWDEGKKYSK